MAPPHDEQPPTTATTSPAVLTPDTMAPSPRTAPDQPAPMLHNQPKLAAAAGVPVVGNNPSGPPPSRRVIGCDPPKTDAYHLRGALLDRARASSSTVTGPTTS